MKIEAKADWPTDKPIRLYLGSAQHDLDLDEVLALLDTLDSALKAAKALINYELHLRGQSPYGLIRERLD